MNELSIYETKIIYTYKKIGLHKRNKNKLRRNELINKIKLNTQIKRIKYKNLSKCPIEHNLFLYFKNYNFISNNIEKYNKNKIILKCFEEYIQYYNEYIENNETLIYNDTLLPNLLKKFNTEQKRYEKEYAILALTRFIPLDIANLIRKY